MKRKRRLTLEQLRAGLAKRAAELRRHGILDPDERKIARDYRRKPKVDTESEGDIELPGESAESSEEDGG